MLMPDTTPTHQRQLPVLLWFVAGVIATLALVVPLLDDQLDLLMIRSTLIALIILVPMGIFFLWSGWSWRQVFGRQPDSVALMMSIVAAGGIWFITWWLMLWLQNDVVKAATPPPDLYVLGNWEANWELLVLTDVVLLPLSLGVLLWGAGRETLQPWPRLPASLLLGMVFGAGGMTLIQVGGVGAVGFLGYGIAGIIAAYLSLATHSAWPGIVLQGSFAYFNLRFYDNMLRQAGIITDDGIRTPEAFFSTDWFTGLILAIFVLLVAVQVSRVRSDMVGVSGRDTTSDKSKRPLALLQQQSLLLALLAVLLSVVLSLWQMLM